MATFLKTFWGLEDLSLDYSLFGKFVGCPIGINFYDFVKLIFLIEKQVCLPKGLDWIVENVLSSSGSTSK